jgi:hypothetical protein
MYTNLSIMNNLCSLPQGQSVNKSALELLNLEASAYSSLAEDDLGRALEYFQALHRLGGRNQDYPIQAAFCLDAMDRRSEAICFLQELRQEHKDWLEVSIILGLLLLQDRQEAEALFILYQAQRALPSNPTITEAIRSAELSLMEGMPQFLQ